MYSCGSDVAFPFGAQTQKKEIEKLEKTQRKNNKKKN